MYICISLYTQLIRVIIMIRIASKIHPRYQSQPGAPAQATSVMREGPGVAPSRFAAALTRCSLPGKINILVVSHVVLYCINNNT